MKSLLNLYDEIRPHVVRYNLGQLLLLAALLLFALIAWSIYTGAKVRTLAAQRDALESQSQELTPQVEVLEAELASDNRLSVLRRRIDRLTLELQARERMLAVIAELNNTQASGFVPLLEALSRSAGGGAWLTRIELADPSVSAVPGRVRLSGRMTDAAALPRYLDVLARQPEFAGLQFTQIEVAADAGQLDDSGQTRDTPEPVVEGERLGALGFDLRSSRDEVRP
jgi:hypothetical protein